PRRISSNSSTLFLLSIPASSHPGLYRWAKLDDQSGPNQMRELNFEEKPESAPISMSSDGH
ncbi:MAG: hypothetical protein ACLQGV_05285, partial [Bryobacteraceae bacterium]